MLLRKAVKESTDGGGEGSVAVRLGGRVEGSVAGRLGGGRRGVKVGGGEGEGDVLWCGVVWFDVV